LVDNSSWKDSAISFDDLPNLPPLPAASDSTLDVDFSRGLMRLYGGDWRRPCDITASRLFPLVPIASTFIDLTEIRVLNLKDFGPEHAADVWGELLSRMPSLRSICMRSRNDIPENLLLALWPDDSLISPPSYSYVSSIPPPSYPYSIPSITHVYIDFENSGAGNGASGQFIIRCLELGKYVGRPPLEKLEIRSSIPVDMPVVEKLKSLAKELVLS
jgi:hypothetical protein